MVPVEAAGHQSGGRLAEGLARRGTNPGQTESIECGQNWHDQESATDSEQTRDESDAGTDQDRGDDFQDREKLGPTGFGQYRSGGRADDDQGIDGVGWHVLVRTLNGSDLVIR